MSLETYWPDLALNWLKENLETELFSGTFNQELNAALGNSDLDAPAGLVIRGSLQDNPTRAGVVVELYENDPDNDSWSHEIYQDTRDGNRKYSDVFGRSRNYWNRRFTVSTRVFFRNSTREDASQIRGAINHRIEGLLLARATLDGLKDTGGETSQFGHIIRENGLEGGNKTNPFWRSKIWLEFRTLRRA